MIILIMIGPIGHQPLYGFLLFQYFSVPKKTADLHTATLEFNKCTIENVPNQPKQKTKKTFQSISLSSIACKSPVWIESLPHRASPGGHSGYQNIFFHSRSFGSDIENIQKWILLSGVFSLVE